MKDKEKQDKKLGMTYESPISIRISILSKRIHRLEDMYADICKEYGMWSHQAERCDKIIKKANNELVVLYSC